MLSLFNYLLHLPPMWGLGSLTWHCFRPLRSSAVMRRTQPPHAFRFRSDRLGFGEFQHTTTDAPRRGQGLRPAAVCGSQPIRGPSHAMLTMAGFYAVVARVVVLYNQPAHGSVNTLGSMCECVFYSSRLLARLPPCDPGFSNHLTACSNIWSGPLSGTRPLWLRGTGTFFTCLPPMSTCTPPV